MDSSATDVSAIIASDDFFSIYSSLYYKFIGLHHYKIQFWENLGFMYAFAIKNKES